jgi:hypothetical protein
MQNYYKLFFNRFLISKEPITHNCYEASRLFVVSRPDNFNGRFRRHTACCFLHTYSVIFHISQCGKSTLDTSDGLQNNIVHLFTVQALKRPCGVCYSY